MTLDTQLEAFFNVETKTGVWRKIILDKLKEVYPNGLTTEEIAILTGIDKDDAQPRTSEMSRCDRDLIRPMKRSINSKNNRVASWVYNPNPKPVKREVKARGDKALHKLMMEAYREFEKCDTAHTKTKVGELAKQWIWASKGLI